MLPDRPNNLSFNNPYILPGANKADWKEILALLDKQINRGTGRATYVTARLEEYINSITNESFEADYSSALHKLILLTRYEVDREIKTHCCHLPSKCSELLERKTLEAINFAALKNEEKLSLIKAYTLHIGVDDRVLDQFSLTSDERAEIRKYYNEELIQFMFYYQFNNVEDFKNHVKATQDIDELRLVAFKVIGSRLLRSSLAADVTPQMQPIVDMKKELSDLLENDPINKEPIKYYLLALTDKYIEYFQDIGFSRYAKCPINAVNYYFSDKMGGGRTPWTSNREVTQHCKPDDLIHIVHGGGLFSILSFLKKEYDGYHLENPGVGLQVHPYTDEGPLKGAIESYEDRTKGDYAIKSAHFIDTPARLTADVPAGAVDRAHRYYEGGLRSKNIDRLSNLTFTIYATGKVYRGDNVKQLVYNIENKITSDAPADKPTV